MKKMKRVKFGGTDKLVSQLCYGAMLLGTKVDEETSFAILDRFVEAGGNFIDTSNNYAFWINKTEGNESEELLGRWFKERGNRKDIFLATKLGARPNDIKDVFDSNGNVVPDWLDKAEGLSAPVIAKAVDDSLKRLGTDHIDLLYAHVDDRKVPLEETLEAFDKVVKAGKVGRIGCSNYRAWRLQEARSISKFKNLAPYCASQIFYTYLRPVPGADFGYAPFVDLEYRNFLNANPDVTLVAYSALLSGKYSQEERNPFGLFYGPDVDERMATLKEIAAEVNAGSLNQVVLAWMMQSKEPPVIPLFSASKVEQMEDSLKSLELELSAEQMERMNGYKFPS